MEAPDQFEDQRRGDQDRFATDAIGHRTQQQRTEHHPDQAAGDDAAENGAAHVEVGGDGRRDEPHRLRIESEM